MTLFFSRRAFNASKGRFTQNPATLTRYVRVAAPSGGVSKANILKPDAWFSAVEAEAQTDDVLIWVHGFNTSQARMLDRQRQLAQDLRALGFGGAVVGFDWPSDGQTLRYRSDRNDAKRVANALVTDAILPFRARPRPLKVHVIAQSMGAFVVLRGFAGVGDAPGGGPGWMADEVLFTGADVDAAWLQRGAWGALVIERRSTRLTNYYSTVDSVLELSGEIINFGTDRAGRAGLPKALPANAVDLRCTERYREIAPPGQNLELSHNWYFQDPRFLADAVMTLEGRADIAMPDRLDVTNGDRALRP
jgi:esterase/lipase superfamily enzyme